VLAVWLCFWILFLRHVAYLGFTVPVYQGKKFAQAMKQLINAQVEVVQGFPNQGFQVLLGRWVVERTFAWLLSNRRFLQLYFRNSLSMDQI
jgi:transposase